MLVGVLCAVCVVVLAGCSDDPPGSAEVTAAVDALAAAEPGSDGAMVELVEAVARDGITEVEAVVVVGHLEEHLDVIGDSATEGGPITRPDTVRFFAALIENGQTEKLAQALAHWSVALAAPAVDAHAAAWELEAAWRPALHVAGAAVDGSDLTDELRGRLHLRIWLIQLHHLAAVTADAHGVPLPPATERTSFVRSTYGREVAGDFESDVIRLAERLTPDSSWADSTK